MCIFDTNAGNTPRISADRLRVRLAVQRIYDFAQDHHLIESTLLEAAEFLMCSHY